MRISDWSSDVCSSDLQARRDRQVVQRVFGGAQFLAQALEGAGVVVVAVDVAQLRRELFESRLVDAAVVLEAVAGAFAQLVDRPSSEERRVGQECFSTGSSRWSPEP